MNDAGNEARQSSDRSAQLSVSLGAYAAAENAALEEAARANVIERIWNKDATLWKQEESHQKIIRNSLG